jgi:hypothetical protein
MLTVPVEIMVVVQHFAPVFSARIWDWVQGLVVGALLSPRQRTVCAALRAVGLSQERQFQNYHRVLNRARWSGLQVSQILLNLLLTAFGAPDDTLVFGADETLERRRGAKIRAKGSFRDSARSSQKRSITSEGLRWMSLMLLTPIPWIGRVWALPVLTLLTLHPKTSAALGKRHKTSIDVIMQMVRLLRRWLPTRRLVLVTDGALVAVKLGQCCVAREVVFVSRLHLNLRFFDLPVPKVPGQRGRQAQVGQRRPTLADILQASNTGWTRQRVAWYGGKTRPVELVSGTALWQTPSEKAPLPLRWVLIRDPYQRFKPTALMCTDLTTTPEQIIARYVMRWNVEVTFQEVRAHLGVETQRQWSDLAIARTTPALLGLFSLVTLVAHHLQAAQPLTARPTAWYAKSQPTFVDALALVRCHLWSHTKFLKSPFLAGVEQFPRAFLNDLLDTLAYAA